MKKDLIYYINNLHEKISLKDFYLIGCQHYLESNQRMIFSLIEKGILPKNVFMINKTYSYNKEIEDNFKKKGINCFNYKYDSHESFDRQFKRAIKTFLKEIKKKIKSNQKIIIVDDGGELIHFVNKILKKRKIYAVEQTSSGFHKLKNKKINFPVINIARSYVKLNYETPYIIQDFLDKLYPKLKKLNLKPKNALIIGKGVLGKYLEKRLKFKSDFFDITLNKEKLKNIIGNYDLIIGATGFKSIPKKFHKKLKAKCCLVSISSSDREFDSVYLRRKISKTKPHEDLRIKNTYLLNNGFPLSFQGNKEEISHKFIQLTRGLMLEGIYEAINSNGKGIIPLNKEMQEKIITKFKEVLK